MLEDDLPTALSAIRDGSLTVPKWLESIRGVRESHWFAPDDPMPLLTWLRRGIQRRTLARLPRLSRGAADGVNRYRREHR
jgi:hypothetical protein